MALAVKGTARERGREKACNKVSFAVVPPVWPWCWLADYVRYGTVCTVQFLRKFLWQGDNTSRGSRSTNGWRATGGRGGSWP